MVLVDDNADFLKQAAAFLGELAEAELVGVARSGPEALELLEQLEADLIAVDLVMPGMSGLELTSRLRTRHPELLVAVVSLHDGEEYRRAALEAGAAALVPKAVFVAVLPHLLRVASARRARAG